MGRLKNHSKADGFNNDQEYNPHLCTFIDNLDRPVTHKVKWDYCPIYNFLKLKRGSLYMNLRT